MSLRRAARSRAARVAVSLAACAALVLAGASAYTIRSGDTLSGIAARFGTTVESLASANDIANPHRIFAGRRLQIGGGGSMAGPHTVRAGQTLSGIASRYGVSVGMLAAANDVEDIHRIYAGQRLRLSGSSGGVSRSARSAGTTHVVVDGETLSGIASRYRVGLRELASSNRLADVHLVRVGQELVVPTTPSEPAAGVFRADVEQLIEQTASRYGWNAAFVKAVAWQESGWNNDAISSVGAVGVMQVLPSTGEFVSTYLVGRDLDLHDPADNIEAGVAFLDYLHRLTGGDTKRILGGYYQGLASMRDNGIYSDTRSYIANVLALRARFD